MAKVAPWYSTRIGETVHHDNTKCTEGNNIETHYRRAGTGGLPLCKHRGLRFRSASVINLVPWWDKSQLPPRASRFLIDYWPHSTQFRNDYDPLPWPQQGRDSLQTVLHETAP